MANLINEYTKIANRLTKLYKDELVRLKLVDSGKLLNSIRWFAVQTQTGYKLSMESLDYFEYLDKKYNISKNIESSIEYEKILNEIGDLYIKEIFIEIDRD